MITNENNNEDQAHDMGIARPSEADNAWSRMQPLYIQPSRERLDQPHQIVDIKNRSDTENSARGMPIPTRHVIVDRFNQGHEIAPGETKRGIDMLAHDIAYFMREGKRGRLDHMGRQKPRHPIEIIGFDPERMLQGDGGRADPSQQVTNEESVHEEEQRHRSTRERPQRQRAQREE